MKNQVEGFSVLLGGPLRPRDDEARVAALRRLGVLERPDADPVLRAATSRLVERCGVSYATVSFVDEDRQWFRGARGGALERLEGTARDDAFCARTVAQKELFVVEDALEVPELSGSPLLAEPIGVRFYAGVPLFDPQGFAVGALSIMDRQRRAFDPSCVGVLRATAEEVMRHLLEEAPPERTLRDAALFRALLAHTSDAVLVHDGKGGPILESSRPAQELVRRDAGAIAQVEATALFQLEDTDAARAHYERVMETGEGEFEAILRRPDGALVETRIQSVRVTDGLVQDRITDRTLARERAHREQLSVAGRVAAGVAHDFNNLLTVVRSHLYLARELLEDEAGSTPPSLATELHASLDQADEVVGTAGALAQQLLALGGRQHLEPRCLDLNRVVRDFGAALRANMKPGVALRLRPSEGPLPVWFDDTQLRQVLLNFVFNARDATEGRGVVAVETARVVLSETFSPGIGSPEKGSFALLSVTDQGMGMSQDVVSRVFDPFFTTKGPKKGTGLGLATVRGIADQSGGYVWAQSEVGIGTTMNVLLPVHAPSETGTRVPREESEGEAPFGDQGGTVLLVEPRGPLRRMLLRRLSNWGFRVLEADSPENARTAVQTLDAGLELDAVILGEGIDLPHLTSLTEPRRRPGIVALTGAPPQARSDSGYNPETVILEPPYGPVALLRALRRARDRNSPLGLQ